MFMGREKSLMDLDVIVLRYSSLVSETKLYHRDIRVRVQKKEPFLESPCQSSDLFYHLRRSRMMTAVKLHQIPLLCNSRRYLSVSLFLSRKLCPGIHNKMVFVADGWGLVLRLRLIILQMFPWIPVKFQDHGKWLHPAEESDLPLKHEMENGVSQLANIRQPPPPPVLAQVQPELLPLSPSRVANPRSGLQEVSQDGLQSSNSYQDLHISVKMMEDFLRLARENTSKNLETCGVLAGSLRNKVFRITTLIIPKQESTSDSCQTLNEEEIFEVQNKGSLFPLGWIHVMLPEAIAIVMAPTDTSSPHGIFHLSDPSGVAVIRNCQQRGFHLHEEPEDGSPIYERCSHVYMNPNLKFDVIDLR